MAGRERFWTNWVNNSILTEVRIQIETIYGTLKYTFLLSTQNYDSTEIAGRGIYYGELVMGR
jgi:hypothetical protein